MSYLSLKKCQRAMPYVMAGTTGKPSNRERENKNMIEKKVNVQALNRKLVLKSLAAFGKKPKKLQRHILKSLT